MAKIVKQYTIQDFNDILSGGFSYDLKDSNVIELISSLANKVGAPTYIKTPVFPKREKITGVAGMAKSGGPLLHWSLLLPLQDWRAQRKRG